jgi:hypothetical protein
LCICPRRLNGDAQNAGNLIHCIKGFLSFHR